MKAFRLPAMCSDPKSHGQMCCVERLLPCGLWATCYLLSLEALLTIPQTVVQTPRKESVAVFKHLCAHRPHWYEHGTIQEPSQEGQAGTTFPLQKLAQSRKSFCQYRTHEHISTRKNWQRGAIISSLLFASEINIPQYPNLHPWPPTIDLPTFYAFK